MLVLGRDVPHNGETTGERERPLNLEARFDAAFVATLSLREKQIQQSYRPIIGIHKWFARRPGTLFRSLMLAEFVADKPLQESYWYANRRGGRIADPFMGGGTPLFEANRLGFDVVGTDINPMSFWIVQQALAPLDLGAFACAARDVIADVDQNIGFAYRTTCVLCGQMAQVKYFLWVKTEACPHCGAENDLFPGYLVAEAVRHPRQVVACSECGALNELPHTPTREHPASCQRCDSDVYVEGPAHGNAICCRACGRDYRYPSKHRHSPPRHRMYAIEYHCDWCKATHEGRFFKQPDDEDLARLTEVSQPAAASTGLPLPSEEIPPGDETNRLHRWGYRRYADMFNERQRVGLGLLLQRIGRIPERPIRHALLTVFSDFLRYQNMLCRYDTYALKCQDIFSVHGFPVGLVQCENSLLGIPRIGAGAFRHFVEKYMRAKEYCRAPFETQYVGGKKIRVPTRGERIEALFGDADADASGTDAQWPRANLRACPATDFVISPETLDGVFTDPPYFDNVQYAELMDFCYVWLRLALHEEVPEFRAASTRSAKELTGNLTLGRGIEHFTAGLSEVFQHYAAALKASAPFVFTYHHNDPAAYVPLVVSILDAGMDCTATLPAAAEMGASLHISGTKSSVLDSVFVCRKGMPSLCADRAGLGDALARDAIAMRVGGVRLSQGDVRCLAAGHLARLAVNELRPHWRVEQPLSERMARASAAVTALAREVKVADLVAQTLVGIRDQDR